MQTTAFCSRRILLHAALFLSAAVWARPCLAAGLLKPVNGNTDEVTMKSHHVSVTINNGFVRTEVDQVFHNQASRDLEAVYSFPIPPQASLSELSLWINGKEVVGEVLEKQQARDIYNAETRKRVDPALAEKNGHQTFDISVFPVVANADTRLRLVYYQPIEIDTNVGRYVYPLAEIFDDGDRETFWAVDTKVTNSFQFDLTLKSAFPVSDVRVPNYQAAMVTKAETPADTGAAIYTVKLDSAAGVSLDQDIVVYYKLDESAPARVELIPYRKNQGEAGTFMVVITPGADLQKIAGGVDWTFALDTSGSMRGAKIATLIDGVSQTLAKLTPEDRFRIVTFNNDARDLTDGYLTATPEAIADQQQKLQALKAGGSTNLYAGLNTAYRALDKQRSTAVILATDGDVAPDTAGHNQFLRLLEDYDVRLFVFVIGNGGDKPAMHQLAQDSGGFAMTISQNDDIVGRILQAQTHILYENMRDVQLKISGVKTRNLTPAFLASLYRGQQLVMFGQYDKPGEITLELQAKIAGQPQSWTCKTELPEKDTDNPELERLWALSSIGDQMQEIRDEGENESLRKQVVKLGMDYSLVTDYTSMLVLEEHRYKELQIERKNNERVQNERQAQQQRASQPVKNYRVDKPGDSHNGGTFSGPAPSFGRGSGPVGPLFVLAAWYLKRKKRC